MLKTVNITHKDTKIVPMFYMIQVKIPETITFFQFNAICSKFLLNNNYLCILMLREFMFS